MGIASVTTIQAYQLNKGGVRARMAILRMMSRDWRKARATTMADYEGYYGMLSRCGALGGDLQWASQHGEYFRNERDASDIVRRLPCGYYTDTDGRETAVGIVASLPHGRFIAGYQWTANDERVYFGKVYDDEAEAARAADCHAEAFADAEREHDERFQAMTQAESFEQDTRHACKHAIQARNVSEWHRERAVEAIAELRAAREQLADATNAYENP